MFQTLLDSVACVLLLLFFVHYVYFLISVLTSGEMDLQYIKKCVKVSSLVQGLSAPLLASFGHIIG